MSKTTNAKPKILINLVHAISSTIADGVPENIQWMPPGRHKIKATRDGKPWEGEIVATEETAHLMQSILETALTDAAAGKGDKPYFDFNHEDREASAHPVWFYWAGDDPVQGGVRVNVEWTKPGREAIEGRAFRRFSPSFSPDSKGNVIGAGVNMGGLVNRAAFKEIAPIWAKDGDNSYTVSGEKLRKMATAMNLNFDDLVKALSEDDNAQPGKEPGGQPPNNNTKETMDQTKMEERVAALETALNGVNAKLTASESKNLVLETRLAGVQANAEVQAKQFAAERVRQAVLAGKIPPQNTEMIEKWTNLIAVDAKNAELLDGLPENEALKTVAAKESGKAQGQAAGQAAVQATSNEPEFIVKARAYGETKGIKGDLEAQTAFAGTPEGSDLYKQFRSNYAPGKLNAAK